MYEKGWPPGPSLVGKPITTATPSPVAPIHHVTTTATLTTITPPVPLLGFMGPLFLVADSVFSWTTSGNIAAAPGTTLVAGRAYQFVYDKATGKWYPLGQDS